MEQLICVQNHKGLHSIVFIVRKSEAQVCNSVVLTDINYDFILWPWMNRLFILA